MDLRPVNYGVPAESAQLVRDLVQHLSFLLDQARVGLLIVVHVFLHKSVLANLSY